MAARGWSTGFSRGGGVAGLRQSNNRAELQAFVDYLGTALRGLGDRPRGWVVHFVTDSGYVVRNVAKRVAR
eukprot:11168736-Lingulodinium_polyedra.AAC.1